MSRTDHRVLPGLGLSLGVSIVYLGLLVLLPIVACFVEVASLGPAEIWRAVWTERARSAYALTFGASLVAALVNVALGGVLAWVLVRYEFPGRRLADALVDLPLALPTAVAGLVYATLYVESGWLGRWLVPLGIHGAYSRTGIVLVLVFVGLPFVVRSVQPVLQDLDPEIEQASASLGASRWQTFHRVILPTLRPALVTGFALAFARSIGEYGSVVFVSGNMPYSTEIAPLLVVARLEEYAYAEATAIALVLLVASLVLLFAIARLERWSRHHET